MLGPLICIRLEANGSATYLTKVTAPDAKRIRSFRILRFSVGQYSRRRGSPSWIQGGTADAGAAYLFNSANGSATYLTKVTAPDANASDVSDTPFLSRAIFSPSGLTIPIREVLRMQVRLIFINWKPMTPLLT